MFRIFWRDERGATAIEYAVIGALVSIAIVSGATSVGGSLLIVFNNVVAGFPAN